MKDIINDLYQFPRYLLGEGYDASLRYIQNIIPLEIQSIPSGTKVGDWTIPDEWVMRDGWVKHNGEKILDWKENPLSVLVGSLPINETVSLEEFKKHLSISDERPNAYPYAYKFYEHDWGFCMPKNKVLQHVVQKCEGGICIDELKDIDPSIGQIMVEGSEIAPKFQEVLSEGDYEVFVDSEYRPGHMKIGVHTIKGKSDREILLFAHLDHPWMANDNLSGVACLIDLAKKIQGQFDRTIKIIFCAETIGSIAYAETNDISKVDFVIALDSVGHDAPLLLQKSFDKYTRLNYAMHLACTGRGSDHQKAEFRHIVGSDEYYFNDPKVGIPGIMISRANTSVPYPLYPEYHTSEDTPDIISEEKLIEVQELVVRIIEIMEKDFIPERNWRGPLMRSQYGIQTDHKLMNLGLDILFYSMDGKKYLTELLMPTGLGFDMAYAALQVLLEKNVITKKDSGTYSGKIKKQSPAKQKRSSVSGKTDVSGKHKKVRKS